MRLSDTAFVLHTRPWRETSLLVEVLGREQGRLGLIARGVQGPKKHVLRAALQPLQLIRIEGDQRGELARLVSAEAGLTWALRRFERDLVEALGLGFALDCDGDGEPIDPAARYRLDPEHGPRRLLSDRGHGERNQAATGRALLALAEDAVPSPDDLASLRLPMRSVLAHHLGPRGLKSWEMIGELGRLKRGAAVD
jgi:DNA repair protein RecO (recombination protein O)